MTRKDYVAVAAAFKPSVIHAKETGDQSAAFALGETAKAVADAFAADNRLFDRARFMTACGF